VAAGPLSTIGSRAELGPPARTDTTRMGIGFLTGREGQDES
jgi:hypothetical protein